MSNLMVKDLMIPLEDYAKVSQDDSLYQAVLALDEADQRFAQSKYRHRAVLVTDQDGRVVGKISMLDVIKGLEPKYEELLQAENLTRFGVSPKLIKDIFKRHSLWEDPLDQICAKANNIKVREIMYTPKDTEHVHCDTPLVQAIHQLLMGSHHSLLVVEDGEIKGVLRLSDVFYEVCERIKSCKA